MRQERTSRQRPEPVAARHPSPAARSVCSSAGALDVFPSHEQKSSLRILAVTEECGAGEATICAGYSSGARTSCTPLCWMRCVRALLHGLRDLLSANGSVKHLILFLAGVRGRNRQLDRGPERPGSDRNGSCRYHPGQRYPGNRLPVGAVAFDEVSDSVREGKGCRNGASERGRGGIDQRRKSPAAQGGFEPLQSGGWCFSQTVSDFAFARHGASFSCEARCVSGPKLVEWTDHRVTIDSEGRDCAAQCEPWDAGSSSATSR